VGSGGPTERMTVQQPIDPQDTYFAVRGGRRNGIDRLFLIGDLDRSSVLLFESELIAVAHEGGAVVLDLRDLISVDAWGLHALQRAAHRAGPDSWRFAIVNARDLVLEAFEGAGIEHLLSGIDLSELLDAGDGRWSEISLPAFLGQRASAQGGRENHHA
jgi:anti-anti-sigma regulatory factor